MEKDILLAWIEEGTVNIPSILFTNYKRMGLNEADIMLILQVYSFQNKGNSFPTPEELSSNMTITSGECASILRKLVQQGFISIEEGNTTEDILFEKYSLKPLWMKLLDCLQEDKKQSQRQQSSFSENELYTIFEKEFGRPLSPLECETLGMWMDQDHHDAVIIKAALKEAVISGKLNFRYIDRILFEWKKNGIETIEQARKHGEKFRCNVRKGPMEYEKTSSNTVPFYNWLEQ
ncbi:DnaD domain-containing protein [Falsibacillus pallidus]|uniref:DnaD domain-containing protein n=1 Tax=Falsibacillus pallidus TaxID=493781 RepID=UPI003D960AC5